MGIDPKRVKEIFLEAAEQSDEAARAAFLDRSCGSDAELRVRVEALLRSHVPDGSFLGTPAAVVPDPHHAATHSFSPDPDHAVTRTGGTPGDAEKDEVPLGFLTPSTRPDSLGRIGHYEILQVLGQGAFGIVFRAFDDVLHRIVAVKVLSPQMAATSPARKRFLREARSSAQVRHENVVQAYEVGEQPLPYIVMEFIPGETLQQRLNRVGPVEPAEVVRIGRQIAEGLAAAHANDLIHRDIKPGNVLLESGAQRVKITDFGLARTADDASISQSGIIAGTPMYMAPEQAKGETLDQRADLFSLGSVLYQMAAGRAPFRANGTVAVLKRVAEDTPRDIREITPETPQWLCDIIAKLHAKNPDDRYQSAREVADVLADCEAQLKANAKLKDFSRIPRAMPAENLRRPWKRALVIPAVVLLVLVGIWAGPSVANYGRNRGELEILSEEGLVSVIVLQNDEGVIDGNKLLPLVTDWLDMKQRHTLTVTPGKYQLNVGTYPEGTSVWEWEVNTSSLLASTKVRVPVVNSSAIITVERGQRVTLRPIMRSVPIKAGSNPTPDQVSKPEPPLAIAPFDAAQAKKHQDAWAKHLGVPVEATDSIGMKFRFIPPGEFIMGSPENESSRHASEARHEITISKSFYLGAHPVTVAQFGAFVKESGYKNESEIDHGAWTVSPSGWKHDSEANWQKPGFEQTDDCPAVCVSWYDAQAFCSWLSRKEGKQYTLPTEAQWEYACRAGSQSAFSFGDDRNQLQEYAWAAQNARWRTHPVGQKTPNTWGLFDLHGNVRNWIADWYAEDYFRNSPKYDPAGPAGGTNRTVRGGSWYAIAETCRSAYRQGTDPTTSWTTDGFRIVLIIDPGPILAPGPFTDADVKRISTLPAAEQVEEVRKELMRRNPGFDGKMETKIEDGVVTEFRIVTDKVTDIAPIRVFNALRLLDLSGTFTTGEVKGQLHDLTPLQGMNLEALIQLDLVHTNVTDAAMVYFKGCKNLQSLRFWNTKLTDAGLANFKECKNLIEINLANTKITDSGLANFKECKKLITIDLSYTRVSDVGLIHFKDCLKLGYLYLRGTKVSDAGLAHLKGIPLAVLTIDDTGVTELTPLHGMPLEHIRLTPKNITPGLDILRTMKSLKTIGIDWRQSWSAAEFWERYDKGEFAQATFPDRTAAEYVLSIGGVIKLNGEDKEIKDVADLPHEVFELIGVWLQGKKLVTDAGLAKFKDCKNLTNLNLSDTQVSDAGLANFKDCKNLEGLALDRTGVSDRGLAIFKDCKDLKRLFLPGTNVSDEGLAHIKDCKKLTVLHLDFTQISDAGLSDLAGLDQLTELNLAKTKVTAKAVEGLAKAQPKCKITWDGGVIEPK